MNTDRDSKVLSKEEIKFRIIEKCNPRLDGKLKTSGDEISCNTAFLAMDEYAQQEAIAFAEWLIDTFTTDEGRLPLSGNTTLGGRTIFINHTEYPFPHTYNLYKEQSK